MGGGRVSHEESSDILNKSRAMEIAMIRVPAFRSIWNVLPVEYWLWKPALCAPATSRVHGSGVMSSGDEAGPGLRRMNPKRV
jgi:hypothetical protein